jgi:hypothetical protein
MDGKSDEKDFNDEGIPFGTGTLSPSDLAEIAFWEQQKCEMPRLNLQVMSLHNQYSLRCHSNPVLLTKSNPDYSHELHNLRLSLVRLINTPHQAFAPWQLAGQFAWQVGLRATGTDALSWLREEGAKFDPQLAEKFSWMYERRYEFNPFTNEVVPTSDGDPVYWDFDDEASEY